MVSSENWNRNQLKSEVTPFNVGDTIRVYAKVVEGSRERLQMFEGVVIKRQGGLAQRNFHSKTYCLRRWRGKNMAFAFS